MTKNAKDGEDEKMNYPLVPPFSKTVDFNILLEKQRIKAEAKTQGSVKEPDSDGEEEEGNDLSTNRISPHEKRLNGAVAARISLDDGNTKNTTTELEGAMNPMNSLPTIFETNFGHKKEVMQVKDGVRDFLKNDLDVDRLNKIHHLLWMAGRPLFARALHRQIMLDMRILRTEQADMHILKVSDRMFVKPLPAYLLSWDFWNENFCHEGGFDTEEEKKNAYQLHKRACGLLLSYVWLIRSELDMRIAKDEHLVPKSVTWLWWKKFVAELIDVDNEGHIDANSLDKVDKRYKYGELRLSRVNSIYRVWFFRSHFIRGYLYGYNRYVVFFNRNFGWMVVIFVYFSLVLSAMQVGISVPPLSESPAFQRASYGFVVFSIVLVAAVVGLITLLFPTIFIINTILSISHSRSADQERKKRRRDRYGIKRGEKA